MESVWQPVDWGQPETVIIGVCFALMMRGHPCILTFMITTQNLRTIQQQLLLLFLANKPPCIFHANLPFKVSSNSTYFVNPSRFCCIVKYLTNIERNNCSLNDTFARSPPLFLFNSYVFACSNYFWWSKLSRTQSCRVHRKQGTHQLSRRLWQKRYSVKKISRQLFSLFLSGKTAVTHPRKLILDSDTLLLSLRVICLPISTFLFKKKKSFECLLLRKRNGWKLEQNQCPSCIHSLNDCPAGIEFLHRCIEAFNSFLGGERRLMGKSDRKTLLALFPSLFLSFCVASF